MTQATGVDPPGAGPGRTGPPGGPGTGSGAGGAASWPTVQRVAAEPVTALLLQRALVMEVAHPKVAAAVADHSSFRSQPWRRALATANAAVRIVFGDEQAARATVRHIQRTHDRIHGEVGAGEGRYTAHDPTLLLWVWATLVDTAQVAFTRWVRPFEDSEAEAFHDEMRSLGVLLGIPGTMLPASPAQQRQYFEDMLEGPELGATPASRELARQVLWYRHVLVPPPVVNVQRSLALATLDRRLLERLQLEPSAADRWLGSWCDGALRAGYRRLPGLRTVPLPLYLRVRHGGLDVCRSLGRGLGRHPYTAPA